MRTHPPRSGAGPQIALLLVVVVAATLVAALVAAARSHEHKTPATAGDVPATAWYGLVGGAPVEVALGQRVIVMLKAPSLAERVARAGGHASEKQERNWTNTIMAAQRQLIADLAARGLRVKPEFQYARVVNGFSTALSAPAAALVERTPGVAGVFPVRAAYPAAAEPSGRPGGRLGIRLPGFTGRGVTIALLDTGVDRSHPFLHDRVGTGYDVVSDDPLADAEPQPGDPRDLELHGTELAGILVGSNGPSEATGLAPGARIYPIRVAGWQRDAAGNWAVYGRTDQLIAGFERAVDPNADGDAHDASRVAVVGVAEPYAAFGDGPEAAAVKGSVDLDTLVVAPAGNDGPAGPRYGSIAGPGAASAALTVGAAESLGSGRLADVSLRAGLESLFDGAVPFAGDAAPDRLSLELALPRERRQQGPAADTPLGLADFFDAGGLSMVAGRAALVPGGSTSERSARAAAEAGASAVVLYGGRLPAGALDLGDRSDVPVVGVPEEAGLVLARRLRKGGEAQVSITAAGSAGVGGGVAPFSSRGLAFDGRLKPDLVAPGVALVAPQPGETEDSTARFGTISGASAATAVTGAAVALLAQARPDLDAAELRGALVGSARQLAGEPRTAQGAGALDLGAAAAAELAADTTTLAFHQTTSGEWSEAQAIRIRNISSRPVRIRLHGTVDDGARDVVVNAHPAAFRLKPGAAGRVIVEASAARRGPEPLTGTLTATIAGRPVLHVPWAAAPWTGDRPLLGDVRLASATFKPSDTGPSVLSFVAGRLVRNGAVYEVQAVSRLDLELARAGAKKPLGVLARMRHLLPGRYAFGLTGRGPGGKKLRPGRYVLRLMAYPTGDGPATTRAVRFRVR
jgi:minor extracellular serine protease Vpr